MSESQIIAHVLSYLITEQNFVPSSFAVRSAEDERVVRNQLLANGVNDNNVRNLQNIKSGPDIVGHFEFNTGRPQRRLIIEAKGGTVRYNFRTVLGQLLELMHTPSMYRWYGLALPADWQSYVYRRLTTDGQVNEVIQLVIANFTRNGQGLYFYWVAEEGVVSRSTWQTFLRGRRY